MPSRLLRTREHTRFKVLTGTLATSLRVEFSWKDPFASVDAYDVITDVFIPDGINLTAQSNCVAKTTTSCTVKVTAINLALPLQLTASSGVRVIAFIKQSEPDTT